MKQIISLIISFITCNSNPTFDNCNDECLLSKLGFHSDPKTSRLIAKEQEVLILNGYDIFNDEFTDNALIWIQPSSYFSDSFMKQITNSQSIPTNDDIRDSLYHKYIASKNLSFKLKIYTNNLNDKLYKQHMTNTQLHNVQNILHQYHFDGYNIIQSHFNKRTEKSNHHVLSVANNPFHQNNRLLLGNYGQGDDEPLEFDMLNQRTYDEYDWFLYGFTIFTFGCLCMCCGWCSHKKYVKDKIIEDDDVQSLATPISPSTSNGKETKYSFAGFNIFGENMHRDGSRTTSNENVQMGQMVDHTSNQVYDIDPMQYQEVLSKTGTKGTPTFGSIMPSMPTRDPRMISNASTNSQMSDIELAENTQYNTYRNGGTVSNPSGVGHAYHNSHTLSPEFKPRDASHNGGNMHSRTVTPLQILSPTMTPKVPNGTYSGNHLSADPRNLVQRQQLELLANAKQFGLYDNGSDETPALNNDDHSDNPSVAKFAAHDHSNRSVHSVAKFGHDISNTMNTVMGTPVTHYGAQVTLGHTPIPPSRNSHAADAFHQGQQSFPQDLVVYEDADGNIVGVAQVAPNGEIVAASDQQLPQLFANHSPNNLRVSPQVSARSLPGMSPANSLHSSRPNSLHSTVPPPISIGDKSNDKDHHETKGNDSAPPPNRPTLITLMSNPDQKQKKSVPHIMMPTKQSAIIPQYKTEMMVSPGTTDVIMSPDSDIESQTHLSLDICIGGSNSYVDGKTGAYGRVILPLKDNDSLQTPIIEEDTELEDRILEQEYASALIDSVFKPAPPPGTPPGQPSVSGNNNNNNMDPNQPRPPPGPPPSKRSPPLQNGGNLGLDVIVEGPEDEEVMSPESVHSLRKTYEDAIASDIIPKSME